MLEANGDLLTHVASWHHRWEFLLICSYAVLPLTGIVIVEAAKTGTLDQATLTKGLKDVLELIPDVSIDVPQVRVCGM